MASEKAMLFSLLRHPNLGDEERESFQGLASKFDLSPNARLNMKQRQKVLLRFEQLGLSAEEKSVRKPTSNPPARKPVSQKSNLEEKTNFLLPWEQPDYKKVTAPPGRTAT